AQIKILKTAARRVEAEILSQLQTRGLQMQLRFNPKLKEQGLLDLK
ncbi:MAG: GIY-YIG nuclease family protein, partial [Chroococcidiopsis sp.]